MAETIQISLNEIPSSPDLKPTGKSVNFGPGADLLMNPNKQKKESVSSDIVLDDLAELNTISLDEPKEKNQLQQQKVIFYLVELILNKQNHLLITVLIILIILN